MNSELKRLQHEQRVIIEENACMRHYRAMGAGYTEQQAAEFAVSYIKSAIHRNRQRLSTHNIQHLNNIIAGYEYDINKLMGDIKV